MPDSFFDIALKLTLEVEGMEFTITPGDLGGPTKMGITQAVFNEARRKGIVKCVGLGDLTISDARNIYFELYWRPARCGQIINFKVAAEVFDTAVNMGVGSAIKILQRSLNYLGEKLKVDGIIGPATIERANAWCLKDPRALYICLNGFQFMRYVEISTADPEHAFPRGWTKRIQDYRQEGVST